MILAANPLCATCRANGYDVSATQVDHIVPLTDGGDNSMGNLQALCAMHHSQKTGRGRKNGKDNRNR